CFFTIQKMMFSRILSTPFTILSATILLLTCNSAWASFFHKGNLRLSAYSKKPNILASPYSIVLHYEFPNKDPTFPYTAYIEFSKKGDDNSEQALLKCVTSEHMKEYRNEVDALSSLNHNEQIDVPLHIAAKQLHIPKLLGVFTVPLIGDAEKSYYCHVTRMSQVRYTLKDVYNSAAANEKDTVARELFRQILKTYDAIHAAGWTHGGLREADIMVEIQNQENIKPIANHFLKLPIIDYRNHKQQLCVVLVNFGKATRLPISASPKADLKAAKNDLVKGDVMNWGHALYSLLKSSLPDDMNNNI
ncbi:hypothetical protein BDF19DRAFT_433196, partial [Syncephalis fuscata]